MSTHQEKLRSIINYQPRMLVMTERIYIRDAADHIDALERRVAELEEACEAADARAASLEVLLHEVATASTHVDHDGPCCWWCGAENGTEHRAGCKYRRALSALYAQARSDGANHEQALSVVAEADADDDEGDWIHVYRTGVNISGALDRDTAKRVIEEQARVIEELRAAKVTISESEIAQIMGWSDTTSRPDDRVYGVCKLLRAKGVEVTND